MEEKEISNGGFVREEALEEISGGVNEEQFKRCQLELTHLQQLFGSVKSTGSSV